MFLCMGFAHDFGHDGFLPMVLVDMVKGSMVVFKSKVNGLVSMNYLACIYMYCNIERNIMKNKNSSPRFGIQGKIFVSIYFMFYVLAIVYFMFYVLAILSFRC